MIIRNLDESLYRRLKAEAALRGLKVSKVLEEAIRSWLNSESKSIFTEMDSNNTAYAKMKYEIVRRYKGKYVVFSFGRFIGSASSLKEAGRMARRKGAERALITKVEEEEPAGGEWLWSSIELSTV